MNFIKKEYLQKKKKETEIQNRALERRGKVGRAEEGWELLVSEGSHRCGKPYPSALPRVQGVN